MVNFTFHKQHTTSCDVTILCACCCVMVILGITMSVSKINCITDFFCD